MKAYVALICSLFSSINRAFCWCLDSLTTSQDTIPTKIKTKNSIGSPDKVICCNLWFELCLVFIKSVSSCRNFHVNANARLLNNPHKENKFEQIKERLGVLR
jgi:hypothetical protein